ncbi:MAG: PPOX class F420-dependent oxidoreductase [Halobacteria archaeon]|nr:PPOX class F420-dependent oxidoreductase [Halobacteria archaeon]
MSAANIPGEYRDLFEKRSFAFVATLLPDGAPHVTPTWVDFDGEHVLINTVAGNRKDRNIQADPRVALAVADPENPYRYLSVQGEVVDRRTDDAREHLDRLAERYTGQARYPGPGGQDRVVLVIRPDRVSGQSPPARGER